jgi:hypothetical protein
MTNQFWKSGLWFIAVLCVAMILISYYASVKIDEINEKIALINATEQATKKSVDLLYANVTLRPDNAYSYYVKARKAMMGVANDKGDKLKAYAPALRLIRQGFRFRYEKPQNAPEPDSLRSFMLTAAQVFQRESKAELVKKDWAAAANSAVDSIRLGEDLTHGNWVDVLTGGACEDLALKNLQKTVNHVDRNTALMLAKRLEKITSQQVRFADIIQAEKRQGLHYYDEFAKSSDWRKQYPTKKSLKEMRKDYVNAMNSFIANAKLPYPQRDTVINIPDDPINREMLGVWDNPKFKELGTVQGLPLTILHTRNALFLLEFALRAYQLQHGNYPQKLSELVPGYLQKIPNDPFATYSSLKYKCDKTAYILYSIGPDGKDDGGKEIKGDRIFVGKQGDILASSTDY